MRCKRLGNSEVTAARLTFWGQVLRGATMCVEDAMQWYQIVGWVSFAFGVLRLLFAGPRVVKLVARPKSWRMPATLKGRVWTDLVLIFQGLFLASSARALWPLIVVLALVAASFLVWVYNFRARRQKAG